MQQSLRALSQVTCCETQRFGEFRGTSEANLLEFAFKHERKNSEETHLLHIERIRHHVCLTSANCEEMWQPFMFHISGL